MLDVHEVRKSDAAMMEARKLGHDPRPWRTTTRNVKGRKNPRFVPSHESICRHCERTLKYTPYYHQYPVGEMIVEACTYTGMQYGECVSPDEGGKLLQFAYSKDTGHIYVRECA